MSNTSSTFPKTIAIDLRGLNFEKRTGINTYTLHALHQLSRIHNTQESNIRIVGIGLFESNIKSLEDDFAWFRDVFDSHISLLDYLNCVWIEKLVRRSPNRLSAYFEKVIIRTTNLILLCLNYVGFSHGYVRRFHYLWLPQPRPILVNSKTQLITVFHDLFAVHKPKKMNGIERYREGRRVYNTLAKRSHEIWGDSFATCQDLISTFALPSDAVRWVSLGVPDWVSLGLRDDFDKQRMKEALGAELSEVIQNHPYIISIASDIPRKNLSMIVAGFCIHHMYHNSQLHLIIIGTMSEARMNELVPTNIRPFVHIIPEADEATKRFALQHAHILVYTSLWEGFGFPILEAFKLHIPVITSLNSGMKELGYNAAMLVDPYDPKELSDAIEILTIDKEFKHMVVHAAQERLNEYTWQEVGANWKRVLNSL